MVLAETFLFIMALAWGGFQFIMRRTYKHRFEILDKHFKKMESKNDNIKVPIGLLYSQRQN